MATRSFGDPRPTTGYNAPMQPATRIGGAGSKQNFRAKRAFMRSKPRFGNPRAGRRFY